MSGRIVRSCGRSTKVALWRMPVLALTFAGVVAGVGVGLTEVASAATTAPTSAASVAPCATRTLTEPFVRWNDAGTYFLVPNGGFENGAAEWTLQGGAAVVSGNETFDVAGAGSHSLQIPPGSQAQSQTMCVTRNEDSIRLFVGNQAVNGSILHVEAEVQNPQTGQIAQTAFDVNGNAVAAGWSPTMVLGIPDLLSGSGTQNLTLIFTTRGAPATWKIDDVFVDPFKSR